MTDDERSADAALAALDAPGLRAVRVLYPDLHGVARGKDIPLRHFPAMAEEGVTFCAAVMGTDLRHTPGRRRRGGVRRPRGAPRPRHAPRRPVAAGGRVVPRRGADARRRRALAGLPALPAAQRRRRVRGARPHAGRRARARVLPRRARRGGAGRHPPLRRRALARLHRRLGLGSARHRAARCCSGATSSGSRRSPRTTSS